jgi:LysM repeat protein
VAKRNTTGLNPFETQAERERRSYYSPKRKAKTGNIPLIDEPPVREQAIESPFPVVEEPVFEFAKDSYPSAGEMSRYYQAQNADAGWEAGIGVAIAEFAGEITGAAIAQHHKKKKEASDLKFDSFEEQRLSPITGRVLAEQSETLLWNENNPDDPRPIMDPSQRINELGMNEFVDFAREESFRFQDDTQKRAQLESQYLVSNNLVGVDLTPEQEYNMIMDVYFGPPLDVFKNGDAIIGDREQVRLKLDALYDSWGELKEKQTEFITEFISEQQEMRRVPDGTASGETYESIFNEIRSGFFSEDSFSRDEEGNFNGALRPDSRYYIDDETEVAVFAESVDEEGNKTYQFAREFEEMLNSNMGGEIGAFIVDQLFFRSGYPQSMENIMPSITQWASRWAEGDSLFSAELNIVLPFFKAAGNESFDSWINTSASRGGPGGLEKKEKTKLILIQSLYNASMDSGKSFDPEDAFAIYNRLNSNEFTDRYNMLTSSEGQWLNQEYTREEKITAQASLKGILDSLNKKYNITFVEGMDEGAVDDLDGIFMPYLLETLSEDPLLAGHVAALSLIAENRLLDEDQISLIQNRMIDNLNLYPITDNDGNFISFGTDSTVGSAESKAFANLKLRTANEQIPATLNIPEQLLMRDDETLRLEDKIPNWLRIHMSQLTRSNSDSYPDDYIEVASEYIMDNFTTVFWQQGEDGVRYVSERGGIEPGDLMTFFFLTNPEVQRQLMGSGTDVEFTGDDIIENFENLYRDYGDIKDGNYILSWSDPQTMKRNTIARNSTSPRSFSIIGIKKPDGTEVDLSNTFTTKDRSSIFRSPWALAYSTKNRQGKTTSFSQTEITDHIINGGLRDPESKSNRSGYLWGLLSMSGLDSENLGKKIDRFNYRELKRIQSLLEQDSEYFVGMDEEQINILRANTENLIHAIERTRKKKEPEAPEVPAEAPEAPAEALETTPEATEAAPEAAPEAPEAEEISDLPYEIEKGNIKYLRTTQGIVEANKRSRFILMRIAGNPNRIDILNALIDGAYGAGDGELLAEQAEGLDRNIFLDTIVTLSSNPGVRNEFFDFIRKSIVYGLPEKQDYRDIKSKIPKEVRDKKEVKEWLNISQLDHPVVGGDAAGNYNSNLWNKISDIDQRIILKGMVKALNVDYPGGSSSRSPLQDGKYTFPTINDDVSEGIRLENVTIPPRPDRKNYYTTEEINAVSKNLNIPLDVSSSMELISDDVVFDATLQEIVTEDNPLSEGNTKLVWADEVDPRYLDIDPKDLQKLAENPNSKFYGKTQEEIHQIYLDEHGIKIAQYQLLRQSVEQGIEEASESIKSVLGVEIDSYRLGLLVGNKKVFDSVLEGVIDRSEEEGEPPRKAVGTAEVLEAFLSIGLYERYNIKDDIAKAPQNQKTSMVTPMIGIGVGAGFGIETMPMEDDDTYTVVQGDTVTRILQKIGEDFTLEEFKAANPQVKDINKIYIGQKLNLPQKDNYGFQNWNTARIAAGIIAAEHRGTGRKAFEFDASSFIRTKHKPKGGSTAFGPGQITGSTASDLLVRGKNLSPELKKWIKDTFIPATKNMLIHGHGGPPKNPKTPFPTKHPYVKNEDGSFSNILTATAEIDRKHYVIPTMVDGKKLEISEAIKIAKEQGLDKYPSFDTHKKALAESKKISESQNYDPKFDYGGTAGLDSEENFRMYNEMWGAVIEQKLKDAGVTIDQVIKGGTARNKFLSKYYKSQRESAYDTSFAKGLNEATRPKKKKTKGDTK